MAFTKLVSNIIKQKVMNNLVQGFSNAAFGQPKKLAAKLANKSPLDLSKSPVAHMGPEANPYTEQNSLPPVYDSLEMSGVVSADPRIPYDVREIICRTT